MLRAILAFMTLTMLLNLGCPSNSGKAPLAPSQVIGEVELYTFTPNDQDFLSDAQPLILPPDTLLTDALESLGRDLARSYFLKTYTDKQTDIHFEVLSVDEIPTPSRPLRIAVVNMVDTDTDAMKYFFQGSAGGQTTFYMLAATFMQPHLSPPLLDGLVLLYNGKILPELDHINLTGILTPRSVQHVAKRAIHGARRKALFQTMTGENCAARNIHKLNDSPHTPRGLVSHNKWPYAGFREGQQHRAFRIPPSRTLCKQVSGGNKCSAIVAEPWVAEWRDCGIRDRGKAFPWHVQVSFQI